MVPLHVENIPAVRQLSFQIANDHYHPWASDSPNAFDSKRYESAFTKLTDYYTMLKIGVTF
jgi:hypothetical protein